MLFNELKLSLVNTEQLHARSLSWTYGADDEMVLNVVIAFAKFEFVNVIARAIVRRFKINISADVFHIFIRVAMDKNNKWKPCFLLSRRQLKHHPPTFLTVSLLMLAWRARICELLRSPGTNSKETIPPSVRRLSVLLKTLTNSGSGWGWSHFQRQH